MVMVKTAVSMAGSASAEIIISREEPMPPNAVPTSSPASARKNRARARKPASTTTSATAALGRPVASEGSVAVAIQVAPNTM